MGTGLFRIDRTRVPVACSHGGSLHYRDGGSHRPGISDHHDGLVRRARGAGIGARWARVQHGEVSKPLHAAHIRLCDGELLRQFDPRTWFFHQGLYRWWHNKSSEPDWRRWFHLDAERDPRGIFQDRAVNIEQHDESLLCDRVLRGPIPVSHAGRDNLCHPGLRCDCGNDHWIARAYLYPIPCLRQARLALLVLLVLVNVYILFKIPTMTHSLFTGGTGGHGGGLGLAMMAIRAAM